MKKGIGIIACWALSGCSLGYVSSPEAGLSPGIDFSHQSRAPLPWVTVLPSEEALAMKNVDFNDITTLIHFDLAFHIDKPQIKNTRLILIDYKIQSPKKSHPAKLPQMIFQEVIYPKNIESSLPQYVMKMSIYTGNNKPPCKPDFEETIKMNEEDASPSEAITLLAHEIIMDFTISKLDKFDVNLD